MIGLLRVWYHLTLKVDRLLIFSHKNLEAAMLRSKLVGMQFTLSYFGQNWLVQMLMMNLVEQFTMKINKVVLQIDE